MKITAADADAAGICSRVKAWIRKHGWSWDEFCGDGIELDDMLAAGDCERQVLLMAEAARRRHGQE